MRLFKLIKGSRILVYILTKTKKPNKPLMEITGLDSPLGAWVAIFAFIIPVVALIVWMILLLNRM